MRLFFNIFFIACGCRAFCISPTQNGIAQWTSSPFEQNVFVENNGQFNSLTGIKQNILFQVQQGGLDIYFTTSGIAYYHKEILKSASGKSDDEDIREIHFKDVMVEMQWVGSNAAVKVIPDNEVSFFYTYSFDPKTEAKEVLAHAYKKITYKDLYPGVDIEYELPLDKGGLKYSVIVHPGADLHKVKMHWSDGNIFTDADGNAVIETKLGKFTDHFPVTNYLHGGTIASAFLSNKNILSFSLDGFDNSKEIIIDPWIVSPALTSVNKAYDVNYDFNGNVYVYGGGNPTKLAKFNSSGTLQWIFNASIFLFTNYYGDFTVDGNSGTCYIGEPYNAPSARVLKVNSAGVQTGIWSGSTSLLEVWRMEYNYCSGTVLCTGGGTAFPISQAFILDTTMTNITPVDVVGATGCCIDVALLSMDPYSNYCYMLFAQVQAAGPTFDNILVKCPMPSLIPPVWNIHSGHPFMEGMNAAYVAFSGGLTNGFNGIAVSPNYVYTYDGDRVKRWNKFNGSLVDTLVISNTLFNWGGLAVDECNNLLVGFQNSIQIYDSTHALISTIPLPDTVYDFRISGTKLYACGNTFVTQIDLSTIPIIHAILTSTPATCSACNGTATVNISSCISNPNFSYQWSPGGQTTQTATALCTGTYHVTITDNNSCNLIVTDSVIVNTGGSLGGLDIGNDTTICQSSSLQLSANISATSFLWSTGDTAQSISVSLPGTYWLIASSGPCNDTDSITITTPAPLQMGGNYSLCSAEEITLSAGNYPGAFFSWSTGETSSSITVREAGTYYVLVSYNGCLLSDSATVSDEGASTVYIPNVFTPNGDKINETFMPVFQNISSFHLSIFNRWGELIFDTTDPSNAWDGKYKGRDIQMGVYLYAFTYTGNCGDKAERTKYGAVTLIR